MDLRMGKPTLNAWKIILVGFWANEVEDFARPEAVAGYPARRPQAFGREDNQSGFQALK
jgi:hypothetical protein